MSPVAFVLLLDRGEVAAALELLRRICDPNSRSLPHITVRYSSRRPTPALLNDYAQAVVEDLTILEPETFDPPEHNEIRTVILSCEADSLERRSHKPDFPDSYFHITLYDGAPSAFAHTVLHLLRQFPWNLRLLADAGRVVEVGEASAAESAGSVHLTDRAVMLLRELLPDENIGDSLPDLADADRLHLVTALCQRIHSSNEVSSADEVPPAIVSAGHDVHPGQAFFWTEAEVAEYAGIEAATQLHKRTGTYLTPPEVAMEVCQAVAAEISTRSSNDPIHFADPAIGPGIFFATFQEAAKAADIAILRATGIERNPVRARRTASRWRRAGLNVINGDFLQLEAPDAGEWDALAANPPYIRHQRLPEELHELRKQLSLDLSLDIDGRSDAYVLFVLRAHQWLKQGAIAGWLLPSEFLFTRYGRTLRTYLLEKVELVRVHSFDSRASVFDHARITSTVILYRRRSPSGAPVRISSGGSLAEPEQEILVTPSTLSASFRWTFSDLSGDSRGQSGTPITELADIKRGIATGANSTFVLDVERRATIEARDRWLRPLLPRPRHLTTTTIEASPNGDPLVSPRLWLIDSAEGIDSIRRSSPTFADYLQNARREIGSRTLVRKRRPFYRQEHREPPPIVAAYMAPADSRGRRFFRNLSNAVVLNNYVCIYPRTSSKTDADRLFEALVANEECITRSIGRVYSTSLIKIEPGDLRRAKINLDVR